MKVIFLDVDGVLINRESCRAGFGKVDPNCVAVLNALTDKTGAMLVISSCWRIGRNVPELRDMFAAWGVTGKVLDRTINNYTWIRGQEIDHWLRRREEERGDVESMVIIDDDEDMGDWYHRLVKTEFEPGLTQADANKAERFLNVKLDLRMTIGF